MNRAFVWKFKCAVVKGQKSSLAKRSNTEQHKGGKENIVKAEWPTLSRIKNSRLNNCSCFLLPVPEAPRRPRSVLFTSLLLLPTFPHTHTPTEGTVRSQHSSPRPHWALTRRLLLQPPPPPPLPLHRVYDMPSLSLSNCHAAKLYSKISLSSKH